MTTTYTFDVFSSLDGFGAAGGEWTGYWGKQGPELLAHRLAAGVHRAYPPAKLARLAALKDAVDPDNVFHLNHNIAPSRAGVAR